MTESTLYTLARIPPTFYRSADILTEEQSRIFERNWQFVGFTDELENPNDFVTATIGRQNIVIQNFDGRLRGFHNVCSHRHARLRAAACGNGLLRCSYHGWTYNEAGVPVGIPANAEAFQIDRNAREALALKPIAVERCGRFVFARIAADGESLNAALGAYADAVAELSETFTDSIADCSIVWTANWKLAVESAIEVYHAGLVHPTTFAKVTPNAPVFQGECLGEHSYGRLAMSGDNIAWWERVVRRLKLQRLERYRAYDHYQLFPNLLIALSYGSLMCLQTYQPIDAGRCLLRYRLRFARSTGEQNPAVRKAVVDALTEFNSAVVAEDIAVTTRVQEGVADAAGPALLGANERRLAHFQDRYMARMI
ncbi:(2Fe-2S)-binding protein [Aliidongia dinghuensis]|uniref:(2Fe-2S)-binding protein n=1 Tax=Aliidongia dinghuensis TaxID=1867774 RepID=A0A8J2YUJ6_9PROT|nr:aromatic ring-hydroxylating dioxygenase subunit alpha [Aliidongia dinghuensis]GGF24038.1 (2Fe-2S)-binding protein [Aliidongia dinghuensis]